MDDDLQIETGGGAYDRKRSGIWNKSAMRDYGI